MGTIKEKLAKYRIVFYILTFLSFLVIITYLKSVIEKKSSLNVELLSIYGLFLLTNMFIVMWIEGLVDEYLEGIIKKFNHT